MIVVKNEPEWPIKLHAAKALGPYLADAVDAPGDEERKNDEDPIYFSHVSHHFIEARREVPPCFARRVRFLSKNLVEVLGSVRPDPDWAGSSSWCRRLKMGRLVFDFTQTDPLIRGEDIMSGVDTLSSYKFNKFRKMSRWMLVGFSIGLMATPALGKSKKKQIASETQKSVVTTASLEMPLTAVASTADLARKLSERLQASLRESNFKDSEIGIWIGTKGQQGLETYFAQNAEKPFLPASLSKLVTAGAILSRLQPDHKFKTQLLGDVQPKNGVLSGSLYLKGGGDPSFVSENMWFLVNELTRAGVTSIEGDIVVDDTRFDKVRFGEDRQKERVDRAYDAPIGAMSMNWNSVNVYVRPGEKVGDKLRVFADVMSPYLKIRNETRTTAAGKGKTVGVERQSEKGFDGDVLVVSGAMAVDQPEFVIYKSISQPDKWAGYNLMEFLKQRGIQVKGGVHVGVAPTAAQVLATSESKPLAMIVADMAKWSNNYVAEMLVKNLSAEAGEAPASMSGGMAKVHDYLDSLGLPRGSYEFINAAGFTRENRLTPLQLGRFLEMVHSDFTIFPEYLSSLPIAGVDGTLRSRMKNSNAQRWVRAKTGLLNGTVGLAGYAGRANGVIVTFAFIYNGAAGREDRARALFDRMAAQIAEE